MDSHYLQTLINVENFETADKVLSVFLDFYGNVMYDHHYDAVRTQREADAHIILQMFFSKALHFKHLLKGVILKNDRLNMNRILDPTLLFTLVRNQYECLCLFELINIIPNSEEKKDFLSLIHQISGLKYRQRFKSQATTPESICKLEKEAEIIDSDVQIVKSSSVFNTLDSNSKNVVHDAIKHRKYQLFFKNDTKLQELGWKDFADKFGMKKNCIDNLYSYLCLNAHPSYPSIMQFRDAFAKNNPEFIRMALFATQTFIIFLSVFIVDYMKMFPVIIEDFKRLSEETQMILTVYNDTFRKDGYKMVL